MNRSGAAVEPLVRSACPDLSDLIIIHDDLDLAMGRLQIKFKGGHGGHRGIESILVALRSDHFYRLRVGVGKPLIHQPAEQYVLSAFLAEEKSTVQSMVQRAVEALNCFVRSGPEAAMNQFN